MASTTLQRMHSPYDHVEGLVDICAIATLSTSSVEKDGSASLEEKASYESSEPGGYRALWPHIKESAIVRKIDLRVVPFVFISNFFTFLDR